MDPLVFEPYLRPMVWGGRRLATVLNKPLPSEGTYGESWEISAHPLHVSVVAEGKLRGARLDHIVASDARHLFDARHREVQRFPWLVKFLDCHERLSVQVHPNDAIARRLIPGELGKTEAWVVIAAEPGARVWAGLNPGVTRADLERHLAAGTVDQCLHSFVPESGDIIFLPAGTVHAVGGGVLLAEVQQSSDATFRLYDWGRVGPDGRARTLHVDEALQSIDWEAGPVLPLRDEFGGSVECPYFELEVRRVDRASTQAAVLPGVMSVWMVLEGSAVLTGHGGGEYLRGETVLLPATAGQRVWIPRPTATLLSVRWPNVLV